jgi:tRNA pseudouridine38-40 synthase
MRTIKLVLEYDGTGYVGWQVQANGPSIQAALERALAGILGHTVRVVGAGRTDSGVHAAGQVASLRTERNLPLRAFVAGTNGLLPRDIAVLSAEEREGSFDARRSARGKHYRYQIMNRGTRSPLASRCSWEVFRPLDASAMQEAARPLLGKHDFSAFRAADCQAHHAVRDLTSLQIQRDGDRIFFDLSATAFLKHMVRNIIGSLVEVGLGRRPVGWIAELLSSRDRARAGATAPAQGLCLVEVFYAPGGKAPDERGGLQAPV